MSYYYKYRYIVGKNMEKKKKFINKIDAYVAYVRLKKYNY